jgi:hypothetical protein
VYSLLALTPHQVRNTLMGMVIPQKDYDGLRSEASKHSQFSTFRDEVLRLAESVWHHARMEGDIADPNQDQPVDESPEEVTPEAPVLENEQAPVSSQPVTTETPREGTDPVQPQQAPSGDASAAQPVTTETPAS